MAEAPTPETLLTEERELLLDTFDYTFAWELGRRMHGKAVAAGMPVAIEITHGADPVFFALAPGATPDNKDWVRRKRNVALRFQHSSLYMRVMARRRRGSTSMPGIVFQRRSSPQVEAVFPWSSATAGLSAPPLSAACLMSRTTS